MPTTETDKKFDKALAMIHEAKFTVFKETHFFRGGYAPFQAVGVLSGLQGKKGTFKTVMTVTTPDTLEAAVGICDDDVVDAIGEDTLWIPPEGFSGPCVETLVFTTE